jgi:hypothetical protein
MWSTRRLNDMDPFSGVERIVQGDTLHLAVYRTQMRVVHGELVVASVDRVFPFAGHSGVPVSVRTQAVLGKIAHTLDGGPDRPGRGSDRRDPTDSKTLGTVRADCRAGSRDSESG